VESGLYYLQSRYYDSVVGRFLNADVYASTGDGIVGNNMFAYCLNNPVNYLDSFGEHPIALGAVPVGFLIVGGIMVLAFVLREPHTQQALSYAGEVIGNGIGEIGNGIASAWEGVQSTVSSWTSSVSIEKSISKSMAKTETRIHRGKNRHEYWIAVYIDFGSRVGISSGTYIPTAPIHFSLAIPFVKSGGNVFADSKRNAYKLALAVGNGNAPISDPRHKAASEGYWDHYHDGKRTGGHIFYVT